jgi:hypothetical protein
MSSDKNNSGIKNTILKRGIQTLVHFTREENLNSILKNGLHSVDSANENDIEIFVTDHQRLDRRLDAISTSISFPNYRMFYNKRINLQGNWAVICLSPNILWEKSCDFYKHNAASNLMKTNDNLSETSTLESMFEESVLNRNGQHVERNQLYLPENTTTDPEAEVLISNYIDLKYITDICFESSVISNTYNNHIKNMNLNIETHFYPTFFKGRKDYQFWR